MVDTIALPSDDQAVERLAELGVAEQDRVETLAARPDPDRHPELWARLDGHYRDLISSMGEPFRTGEYKGFGSLPVSDGPVAMHLFVWLYLTILPDLRRYHSGLQIPESITQETLSSLGQAMAAHRAIFGVSGTSGFGQWCPPLQFRGAEYRVGRLAYDRMHGTLPDGSVGYGLNVHIPHGDPLTAASCDESFASAAEFFGRHYPAESVRLFGCHSWLLDPQLAEYLPDDSNIVRFQRRFELKPLPDPPVGDSDSEVAGYVFDTPPGGQISTEMLDTLPQQTSMQRAYVTHLRAGRHWQSRTGWIRVTGS